jgi:hypothetical protein
MVCSAVPGLTAIVWGVLGLGDALLVEGLLGVGLLGGGLGPFWGVEVPHMTS